jgi:MFS family permease
MTSGRNKNNSRIEHFWDVIQFGFVRILISMGAGLIIASILNPSRTGRLIGLILYNPYSLSSGFKLDEIWILLGFGIGLIIFGILLYTFMYLTEYRFKLLLQRRGKSHITYLQKKKHSQLLELQFIITISFLLTFAASRALVVMAGESKPSLELWIGNYHIHHFFIGILLLSISGWIGLAGNLKKYKYISAILYGGGLGLLVDEIGLLLTWGNYWAKQSYIFSVIVVFIFLSIILYEHMKARKKAYQL